MAMAGPLQPAHAHVLLLLSILLVAHQVIRQKTWDTNSREVRAGENKINSIPKLKKNKTVAHHCHGDSVRLWRKHPCGTCHQDEIWVRQHLHMWPFLAGRSRTPWPPGMGLQPEQHPSPAQNTGCHPSFFYFSLWLRGVGRTNKESLGVFQLKKPSVVYNFDSPEGLQML